MRFELYDMYDSNNYRLPKELECKLLDESYVEKQLKLGVDKFSLSIEK